VVTSAITVALVDDCSIMRDTLEQTFSALSDIRLTGYAEDGLKALDILPRCRPDVAVVDLLMPKLNGFELAEHLLSSEPSLRILFFSGMYSHAYVEHAKKIGAAGWVVKGSPYEIVAAIRTVARGAPFYWPQLNHPTIAFPILSAPRIDVKGKGALTQREVEILHLWTQGFEVKEIAGKLGITAKTVETHRAHIIRKTGTRSLAQLTKFALARGITPF
jgi:DNA-binding NarL/FixJ family response regulator